MPPNVQRYKVGQYMIPYGRQEIVRADVDAVVSVLRSDWLTQGPVVPRFEEAMMAYTGVKHAVAVNSATSALHIACMALDVRAGDWVWTTPNTFVASANCALFCGAKVDFVDIDPRTYNLSTDRLIEKLEWAKSVNKLPKVLNVVHFSGQACDMLSIKALSREYGFRIIEDASHAVGALYDETKVGACIHSDITVFSFHPVKIITTGEGGMALTNDQDLAARMIRYRSHGIVSQPQLMEECASDEIWNYQQVDLGYNYRMTDIQAALGVSQLKRLDEFVAKRHAIAERYNAAFSCLPIITPWQHPKAFSSYHLYVIRIREDLCGKSQRSVYADLMRAGVSANLHYIPVYRQPYYQKLGFKEGYCPEAELYFREAISLPIYPALSEANQQHVVETIKRVVA